MKRTKIFATIVTLCLAISTLAYGVYAATNLSFTIGANVAFEVSNVFFELKLEVSGVYNSDNEPIGVQTFSYNYGNFDGSLVVDNTALNTWASGVSTQLNALRFNSSAITPISMKVIVKNRTPSKDIGIVITDNVEETYVTKTNTPSGKIDKILNNTIDEGFAEIIYTPKALATAFSINPTWNINIAEVKTITLNYNNGTGTPANFDYVLGTTINSPSTPTRTDYNFSGWVTTNSANAEALSFPCTLPDNTTTLYAKWVSNATYSVTLQQYDGRDDTRMEVNYGIISWSASWDNGGTANGTDIWTMQTISNIPAGSTVTVTINPDVAHLVSNSQISSNVTKISSVEFRISNISANASIEVAYWGPDV